MIKEYCDICGREKHTTKYKLPIYKKKPVLNAKGAKIIEYDVLTPVERDVCIDCASLIEGIIRGYSAMRKTDISGFDINDGHGVHITGE